MKRPTFSNRAALFVLTVITGSVPALGQQDYGARLGTRKADVWSYQPQGTSVLRGTLDPAMRKWYVPGELYEEYRWRQWEYTNYARDPFQRYVDINLEGDYYYDLYGNFISRGWLIFNHSQDQPQAQLGNSLFKDNRFTSWFNGLLIASDHKGQYHTSLSIGSSLRTVLTPMTFSKPDFDGLQWDFASDKYEATIIYSRINLPAGSSTPRPIELTNNTSLFGGRMTAQVGDFVRLGVNFVNAHQSHTDLESFEGSLLKGELTQDQNGAPVEWVELILRDDSPEDGEGGASFFEGGSDLVITYIDGEQETARQIGFEPVVQGGFERTGFRAADGSEEISVRYDFNSTGPAGFVDNARGDKSEIERVRFQLPVGNDYQVWVNSNRQTTHVGGGSATAEQTTPLLVARAEGNVQDNSNLRLLSFDYGLPTGTQIAGATIEVTDVLGFSLYGEYDVSHSYRMYPNANLITHDAFSGVRGDRRADAWMVNLSKQAYPFFLFGEAFSMDHDYSTTTVTTNTFPRTGFVDYGNPRSFYEFVDDNDDQDRIPDLARKGAGNGDFDIFPGWDENNDFISDFNQNDNRRSARRNEFPDYEEPFLRFNVDRPEFLFGPDMNNNGWIDRFENDNEPDYPYRRDHRGYNVYAGANITPEIRAIAGRMDERLISQDRHNETNYLLATFDRDYPGFGRLRVYDMVKRARDDIRENLLQWAYQTPESEGQPVNITDPLLLEDAWHNSLWLNFDYTGMSRLRFINKVKYDLTHTQLGREDRRIRGQLQNERFFGVINKVGYEFSLGMLELEPRWKSEYRNQTRDHAGAGEREELTELFSVLGRFPILTTTYVEAGVEYILFRDLREDLNDRNSRVLAVQFTNTRDYLGYKLSTQMGVKFDRRDPENGPSRSIQSSFISVFAGLE